MKIVVSLPDSLFVEAEQLAKRLRMSRSKLYATALTQFLNEHRSHGITERLNEVYDKEESQLDPVLHALQLQALSQED